MGILTLNNFKGSNQVDYDYIVRDSVTNQIITSGTITENYLLVNAGVAKIDGLPADDNYTLRLSQDQSVATGCLTPIYSDVKSFKIIGPADTLGISSTTITPMANEPMGEVTIDIHESKEPSYQAMFHMIKPLIDGHKNNWTFDSTWVNVPYVEKDNGYIGYEFDVKYIYPGDYQFSIRDSLGCVKNYNITVNFGDKIFIPNIFTPNNDGKNDNFEILNLPDKSKVIITNRWGKEVYSSSNFQKLDDDVTSVIWSGGSESDGVYFYSLKTPGKTYTGWIEIRR